MTDSSRDVKLDLDMICAVQMNIHLFPFILMADYTPGYLTKYPLDSSLHKLNI